MKQRRIKQSKEYGITGKYPSLTCTGTIEVVESKSGRVFLLSVLDKQVWTMPYSSYRMKSISIRLNQILIGIPVRDSRLGSTS